jgi:starch synthase
MYAQRFGTLPIAHRTGGLAETIEDGKSGFLFSELSPSGLLHAVKRAVETYAAKRSLNAMRRRAMGKSYDWHGSARLYDALYGRVIGTRLVRAKPAVDPAAFATRALRA